MKTKEEQRAHFDSVAVERLRWISRNRYYHEEIARQVALLVPPGRSVLEIG